jgi:uncharacterized protein (TIRG00374 family)
VSSAVPQEGRVPADNGNRWLGQLLSRLLLSGALGALFAWLVARGGVPLVPPADAFSGIAPWTIPAYVASLLVLHFFRASRWRFLIAPVRRLPLREVIVLNWIGFFAIFALPLRLGEVARPALTKMRHGIPVSVGLGTVAVERVIDGMITSGCVAWALFMLPRLSTDDPIAKHLPLYGMLALALFCGAFVALAVFLWKRAFAVALTERAAGLVSPRLGRLLAEKVGSVADGLRSIGDARLGVAFVIESLLYWGVNALGVWMLARGCGLPLGLGHAAAIMGVLAIGILLPTGPGLFGNFQLAVAAALRLYLPEDSVAAQGATFIFLLYVCQSAVMLLAGVVPLYALKLRLRDLMRLPTDGASGRPVAS